VRRFLSVLILAILFSSLGFWSQNTSAEQPSDQDMTPSQLHQMLADMKQERLNRLREVGKMIPLEGTLAQSYYDAKYYRLDLNLDDTTEIISGSVFIYAEAAINGFNVLELNFFDNPDMYIDSIKSEDVSLSYTWTDNIVSIFLSGTYDVGQAFGVTVYYHGHPLEGGLQSFDWGYHGSPLMPIMCTLSCPYFSQSWWPCKDLPKDKADSADVNVTLRGDLYLVSNGLLREIVDHGSTKTFKWHHSYPVATYLIFLSATNYSMFSNWYQSLSGDSMQVNYYAYPERLSQAMAYWQLTPSIIHCFADLFGEYPFIQERYGMAHFSWNGSMEHQTCASMYRNGFSEYLVAHELSHQWWGDYISPHNWHHAWLNEGAATYCEALWEEHRWGEYYYHQYMNDIQFFGAGSIFVQDTTDAYGIFSLIIYDKGGWVHHMLRNVVGDSAYFAIMRAYYSDPRFAYGVAETEDFQEVCETVSGIDLDYFFQEWIYGTYYPKYEYSFISEPAREDYYDLFMHIDQTQTTDPTHFTMPIDIAIGTDLMDTTIVVFNDPRHEDFALRVRGTVISVDLDPDRWVLRQVLAVSYGTNVITTDLPVGYQAASYTQTLSAKGGVLPYSWELESGSLPDGLELDPLTGVISGQPTVVDSFDFAVRVTDSDLPGQTDTQQLFIIVKELNRGDVNNDSVVDLGDLVYIINYLYKSGPEPIPWEAGDLNCDEIVDLGDVVYLINYLYRDGPPPC